MMYEMEIREVKIAFKQWETDGLLYFPKRAGKFPVVVFSHGYNGFKMDFDETAKYLAERGIASLCYTFCGGSTRDASGMPTTEMTIFSEIENLKVVLDYVKQLEQVDADNVFTFGGSQGGLVTALTCDDRSEEIRGMMLLFPAFCIPENWTERYADKADIPTELDFWGMKLGHDFFESIHGYDVFSKVGKYKNNVLVMHGDQDPIVSLGYSEKIEKCYEHVVLEVFQGEGHGFSPEGNRIMTEMVYEFVATNVSGVGEKGILVDRILRMEQYMDEVSDALKNNPDVLKSNHALRKKVAILTNYMDSGQWLKDYEADERGELPKDLKRGVLSQDGLYNLLCEIEEYESLESDKRIDSYE